MEGKRHATEAIAKQLGVKLNVLVDAEKFQKGAQ